MPKHNMMTIILMLATYYLAILLILLSPAYFTIFHCRPSLCRDLLSEARSSGHPALAQNWLYP